MSKMAERKYEIDQLLEKGLDVDQVAQAAGVPVDWVLEAQIEMMGRIEEEDKPCQN